MTATCTWGWLAGPLSISYIGPLVSFMPIILMGVLFGLAMDYEVFLVSQIREDYVHSGDAKHAIHTGFIGSARVVTAAAIIMISVFAAFIPDGSATIKPIAIGLATGVFVDAFLVGMTLVPAVLAMLGRHAWWIPRWLDRALPSIDVEGQSLVKHVEQTQWDEANPGVAVRAEKLVIASSEGPVETDLVVPSGTVWTVEHDDPRWRSALVWTVAGWRKPEGGVLGVLGRVLPEESGFVRKRARVVPAASADEDELTVRQYLRAVLVAQSKSPWSPGHGVAYALDQAESWLQPLVQTTSRTQTKLEDRWIGQLSSIERQLVALSAPATQRPELLVVQDADAGLGTVEMSWFTTVCHEIADGTGATILLVGHRVATENGQDGEVEPALVGAEAEASTMGTPVGVGDGRGSATDVGGRDDEPASAGAVDGAPASDDPASDDRKSNGHQTPVVRAEGEPT